jgi:E3 ubiquitin-protein ligase SIAH1
MLSKPSSSTENTEDEKKTLFHDDDEISAALELAETARKLLECPVCYQTCRPPRIWQCTNGHLTCDTCHIHSDTCPLCRSSFTNIRPFTAEKLARQVTVTCKNSSSGCKKLLPWQEREEHESGCDYALGNCPILSCSVQFLLKNVLEHLQLSHNLTLEISGMKIVPGGMVYGSQISTANYMHPSSEQQNCWWGPQFVMYDSIPFFFIISRKVDNPDGKGQFYFWVWLGGKSKEARRFLYTITVEGAGGERISYTARPESIERSVSTIRETQSCLMVSDLGVKRFLTGSDKVLKYSVEITDRNLKSS